jgi:hypothetical protein
LLLTGVWRFVPSNLQIPVFEAKMAEAVSALQDLTAKGLAGERQLQVLHQELETARQECEHTKE